MPRDTLPECVEIETGPVIAQYEVQLEAGLRLSKITGLADDLAIALRVPSSPYSGCTAWEPTVTISSRWFRNCGSRRRRPCGSCFPTPPCVPSLSTAGW